MATSQSTTSARTGNPSRRRPTRPRTEEEFLARHEAKALQEVLQASSHLGTELLEATDLRAKVRRHPLLAVLLGSAGGFLVGKAALGVLRHWPELLKLPGVQRYVALGLERMR